MSASLVGSEMCIRDRPLASLRPLTTALGFTSRRFTLASSHRQAADHSVSYTHLTLPTICSV
eukprot:2259028-Alexandrium_andersonii.AAC.1